MAARILNGALGLWLFISAFVWPHTTFHFWVAVSMGVMIMLDVALAFFDDSGRILNALFALYVMLMAVLVHRDSTATLWNALIVGAVVFVLTFVGPYRQATPHPT